MFSVLSEPSHLKDIYDSVRGVREWKELGLYLGVPFPTLLDIEGDKQRLSDRKMAVLSYWVKNLVANKEMLAAALKKMGEKLQGVRTFKCSKSKGWNTAWL